MVMAANEAVPGVLPEDSLSARLQWLKQHREALQKKLLQKNEELKSLCVEEAELTGVLPPEIPLEPGESPPTFRRKVGTSFTYPQNLINKLKTNEAEESALELERQVQISIVEAALGIVNDPAESKAVRRKHRLVYQQSKSRLQELEARLNFIRQSRGKSHRPTQLQQSNTFSGQPQLQNNVKHRTKKPRPPLESTTNIPNNDGHQKTIRNIPQEVGINLSPLVMDDQCNTFSGHSYDKQSTISNASNHNHTGTYCSSSPVDQRQNMKVVEHDHNDNQNVYILPDQYRSRTYSHGSGGSRNHYQDSERTCRPVPNTYTEEERQMRYRQLQQMQLQDQVYNHQQYPDYKHLDNDIHRRSGHNYYERDFRTMHYSHVPDVPVYYKSNSQLQPPQRRERELVTPGKNLPYGGTSSESQLSPGYWMRYGDEIVWCSEEQLIPDRFGSLDRRKRNPLQQTTSTSADVQPRHRTASVGFNKTPSSSAAYENTSFHFVPLNEQPTLNNNKMLLRTQSLGSVESRQSSQARDLQEPKDMMDNTSRKIKEKEWYETSLDSGASPALDLSLMVPTKCQHYQSSPSMSLKLVKNSADDTINSHGYNRRKPDSNLIPIENDQLQQSPMRYERKKVLEIPAESKPSPEANDDIITMGSSQNCTIVHAGKYQPYREVTKPFEMSDFYKYSTKFRKRNETSPSATSEIHEDIRGSRYSDNSDVPTDSNPASVQNGTIAATVQKRIYQPVQRMTCQPYLTSLR